MSCQLSVSCRIPPPKAKPFTSEEIRQMHSEIYGSDGEEVPEDKNEGGLDDRMDEMMGNALNEVFSPETRKIAGVGTHDKKEAADKEAGEQDGAAAGDSEEAERGRTGERRAL